MNRLQTFYSSFSAACLRRFRNWAGRPKIYCLAGSCAANKGSTYTGKPTFNAVITFGAGLTLPSFDLVALPWTTGPVFLGLSTFFSMATVVSPNFDWLLYATS
jgi:hypothetical protein